VSWISWLALVHGTLSVTFVVLTITFQRALHRERAERADEKLVDIRQRARTYDRHVARETYLNGAIAAAVKGGGPDAEAALARYARETTHPNQETE
jgi:hypothetical protein